MTMLRPTLVLVALVLLALPSASGAAIINLSASLDGAQANAGAGTGSAGTGSATITFDTDTNQLDWSGSFTGLTGDYTVSHFHGPALPNQNAGITVTINVTLDPGSTTSGTFAGSAVISDTQEADLLNELWYVNIHSTTNTGGEIRGQVLVPEPGTLALLALGGGVAAVARRRARG